MVIAVLAVIWVVALTPMALRKLSERRLSTSVESFHRQLHSLRRAYPRLAASAADPEMALSILRGPQGGARRSSMQLFQSPRSPAVEQPLRSSRAGLDDFEESEGDLSASVDRRETRRVASRATQRPSSRAARCRRVLFVLGSTVVGFLLLGAIPALRILWDASLLAFGVTAAYLALVIHFHRRAAECEIKVVELPERRREARTGGTDQFAPHYPERRRVQDAAYRGDYELLDDAFEGDYDERVAGGR